MEIYRSGFDTAPGRWQIKGQSDRKITCDVSGKPQIKFILNNNTTENKYKLDTA